MNDFLIRLGTAVVLVPIVLYALFQSSVWWAILVAVVAMQTIHEFYGLMRARGFHPFGRLGIIASGALIMLSLYLRPEELYPIITVSILASFVYMLTSADDIHNTIPNVSATIAGFLYIGWMLTHGVFLRELEDPTGRNVGAFALFFIMATTFLADAGGFFAGKTLGKHKLAPSISPKKTWEGLGGGVIGAMLAGVATCVGAEQLLGFASPISIGAAAALGGANAIVGVIGDLSESVLKRAANVKDSGNLLPGHGGLLDRIDAILFTVPLNFYVFHVLIWGTVM